MTGTTQAAQADTVRARVADECTKVAVPVIMPTTDEAETQTQMPLRQVLIPVDGTPQSEFMVDWALGNFCREGDQVNLLHVIPKRYAPSSTMYGFEEYVIDVPDPEQENAWRADAERYFVRKIYPKVEKAGFKYTCEIVAFETDTTSVGEIVCERAVDSNAAAVIMAAQGKSRIKEFFVGSVTNYCLHRSKVPVIVFRAPHGDGKKPDTPDAAEAKKEKTKEEPAETSEPQSSAMFF